MAYVGLDAKDCEPKLGKIWKTKVLDFTCK